MNTQRVFRAVMLVLVAVRASEANAISTPSSSLRNWKAENPWLEDASTARNDEASSKCSANRVKSVKVLGDDISRPCCTSDGVGRVDCFVLDNRSSVLHFFVEICAERVYSQWQNLEGNALSGVECTRKIPGPVHVFFVNTDRYLTYKTLQNGLWTDWYTQTKITYADIPTCSYTNPNRINCFLRGVGNVIYNNYGTSGSWTGFHTVYDKVSASPVRCTTTAADDVDCFATEATSAGGFCSYRWLHKWYSWENHGSWIKGRPAVIRNVDRIDAFARGKRNQIIQLTWTASDNWLPLKDLGGSFVSDPECITATTNYHIWCFAVGADSHLYWNIDYGSGWRGWVVVGGVDEYHFIESPSCVLSNPDEISCYAQTAERRLVEFVYAI